MHKYFSDDTWEKFNQEIIGKKIILWGAGQRCRDWLPLWSLSYDISYIVDSDEQKWGGTIVGKMIYSPQKLLDEVNGTFVVLICGWYARNIAHQCDKMGITDYFSEYWMNNSRMKTHYLLQTDVPKERIEKILDYLEDEQSKRVLLKIIEKRAQGISDYTDIYDDNEYFRDDFFLWSNEEVYVDAGAYNGDSIVGFIKKNSRFKKIFAFEADEDNYKMLTESYVFQAFKDRMEIFNKGVWNTGGVLDFVSGMEVSCKVNVDVNESGRNTQIECVALDDVIREAVTFIKMDIEGSEMMALEGAKKLISTYKPKLAICLYHKMDDLWSIPEYIHSLVPEYKMYIRHHGHLWCDTVLYATL